MKVLTKKVNKNGPLTVNDVSTKKKESSKEKKAVERTDEDTTKYSPTTSK